MTGPAPAGSARRLVAEGYDRAASRFADAADRHVYRRLAAPLVEEVGRRSGPSAGIVLDVAAGAGAVGRSFPRAVAVDFSLGQLRHNPAPWRVRADGERLPFRADSFAAAVCGFAVNHVAEPAALVGEMARVAPVVGVSTWQQPNVPYPPKQVVFDVLARRAGRSRSPVGELLDHYGDAVGSVDAIARLLQDAGLESQVDAVEVEIPWPGVDAYLDYRLAMPTSPSVSDDAALRAELWEALDALPPSALRRHPTIIVGVGRR